MSNKRYVNQIKFNTSDLNNLINSVSGFLNEKNFKQINVNGEKFFANNKNNPFKWVTCIKTSFNDNVAVIEAWLLGINVLGEINFNEEYGLDSNYGYLWRPISILKAVIRDVESIIAKAA